MAILTSIAVFIATAIDYLIIQTLMFSRIAEKDKKYIWIGQYIGTSLILIISFIASQGIITLIPQYWVGLLGVIPLYLGFKVLLSSENDEDESSQALSALTSNKFNSFLLTYTLIVLASSADDFSIFVPFFTTLNIFETVLSIITMLIMVSVLCLTSRKLASIPSISQRVEKYEKIIVPLVFILLGIFILVENGTIQTFLNFI